jgi:hypothetical protein
MQACGAADLPEKDRPPFGAGDPYWFLDNAHSQLAAARTLAGVPGKGEQVRIAHLDTGIDFAHKSIPEYVRKDLAWNFVEPKRKNDVQDTTSGALSNAGHGTGTIGILAGRRIDGTALGGAANLEVIPIRVANSVVLFKNQTIAQALDYVHRLNQHAASSVQVVTMSMGGLASRAWADAVNALYEQGVFIVTAAGNNIGGFPTHLLVYPARFGRVVAACGVMANGHRYDAPGIRDMGGNYGPPSQMASAMAAYTPNIPWPRLGCPEVIDLNGAGTSAATPQIAAAAALWIQQHRSAWQKYPKGWMRVEAVRRALFDAAQSSDGEFFGHGLLRAEKALQQKPAAPNQLQMTESDSVRFAAWRVLTGLGAMAAPGDAMFELEAVQVSQRSNTVAALLEAQANAGEPSPAEHRAVLEAVREEPGISKALRARLDDVLGAPRRRSLSTPPLSPAVSNALLAHALAPPVKPRTSRRLQIFAFDPSLGTRLSTLAINEAIVDVPRDPKLAPGPADEYVEVVDIDPASGCAYAPVDLDAPALLEESGLRPSEGSPQFHQQMVYAVSRRTIDRFEQALGRPPLWASRLVWNGGKAKEYFIRRLRMYPHALREANAYYSPDRKAILFGYFTASRQSPGDSLPGGTVFTCLSHDIIAHETTHALLDGLHPRFREATNPDVLAFHEAFSDIVALFQHFTMPEALRHQVAKTRGELAKQNLLGELAQQFGQALGGHGALRSAIGTVNRKTNTWEPLVPDGGEYERHTEPHDRGAILVAAVFDAFLQIYEARTKPLLLLATGGTGLLPPGAISPVLVEALAEEASKVAGQVLNICIRALDYCPPVDITFGEYLRALVTADQDLVPDDKRTYRVAFISAFRSRGIYPEGVRTLSVDSLPWERLAYQPSSWKKIMEGMDGFWNIDVDRRVAFEASRKNAAKLQRWLMNSVSGEELALFGLVRAKNAQTAATLAGRPGTYSPLEVHSVRPSRRIGPAGQVLSRVIVEITQKWVESASGQKFRGGCTLIVDPASGAIEYLVRKRVGHELRIAEQRAFIGEMSLRSSTDPYWDGGRQKQEPFALLHQA